MGKLLNSFLKAENGMSKKEKDSIWAKVKKWNSIGPWIVNDNKNEISNSKTK